MPFLSRCAWVGGRWEGYKILTAHTLLCLGKAMTIENTGFKVGGRRLQKETANASSSFLSCVPSWKITRTHQSALVTPWTPEGHGQLRAGAPSAVERALKPPALVTSNLKRQPDWLFDAF